MIKKIKQYGNSFVITFKREELEVLGLAVEDWISIPKIYKVEGVEEIKAGTQKKKSEK
jgi:hypothetical protein